MNKKFQNRFLLIDILVILLIVIITLFPSNVLRIILGLPFLLFFPGYMLITIIYPRRHELGSIERLAFSLGLSIAICAIIGLILNFTPWGIRSYPILASLTILILATSVIAWQRQRRLTKEEKLTVSINLRQSSWTERSYTDKVLSVVLIVVILSVFGAIGYGIASPRVERFTEFYVLGPEGKAEDYPEELSVGEKASVIVGIVNHEHEETRYRVEIKIDGKECSEISQIVLGQDEKWEQEVFFMPDRVGENQKLDFVLYNDGEPYRHLYIWVNVEE